MVPDECGGSDCFWVCVFCYEFIFGFLVDFESEVFEISVMLCAKVVEVFVQVYYSYVCSDGLLKGAKVLSGDDEFCSVRVCDTHLPWCCGV